MKEFIPVRVQYASRQQCYKTHKRPLSSPFFIVVCSNTSAVRLHTFCGPRGVNHCSNYPVCANVSRRCGKHIMTLASDRIFRVVDVGQGG